MPNWFHRTDKTLLSSVAEADLPEAVTNYIESPVFPAGVPATIPYRHLNTQPFPDDTITEMSQAEKDAVEQAILDTSRDETADTFDGVENLERAFALAVLDEINVIRGGAYGGLFRDAAVTSQSIPNNVWTKMNALVGSTAMPVGGGTDADTVAGEIVLPAAGDYKISWHLSFSGANNTTFEASVFGNGTEAGGRASRALGTGSASDIGNMSGQIIANAPVANVAIDLRIFHGEGTARDITVEQFSLIVEEVRDLPDRTIAQMKAAIRGKLGT